MPGAGEKRQGHLIVIEGIDGSGKTTLARELSRRLAGEGLPVLFTFEPTSGPWGQRLRRGFASEQRPSPEEELDLFMKDRRSHVKGVLRPALDAGKVIICDRYYFSTMAYQGARGLDPAQIRKANEAFAPLPDLVILMEIPPEEGIKRIRTCRGEDPNNMEGLDYLKRVSEIFSRLEGPFIRRLDASRPREELANQAFQWTLSVVDP